MHRTIVCLALAAAMLGLKASPAAVQPARGQNTALVLDHDWQFRQITTTPQDAEAGWLPATVPGDVHLDLLANKKIEDPFYRDNESKLQWIENASWEYRTTFDVAPAILARGNVDLVFDGLDSASQVLLNGTQILNTDDAFRVWRVPAKKYLHAGSNSLFVVFPSPITAAQLVAAMDPWQPRTGTAAKTYIRKPAYEYGWDWGPRFVTSGIWKPVHIEAWDKVRMVDFAIRQRDVSKAVAHVDAEVEVESSADEPAQISVDYTGGVVPVALSKVATLHAGRNIVDFPIEIRQPKLWWPAGYGDQPLYEFSARI